MKAMVLVAVMMVAQAVGAQERRQIEMESHIGPSIEGSWEVDIKPDPGPGAPPPVKALITFSPGGTVIETILLPPIVPAHGAWVETGRGRFTFIVVHPLLDAGGNHFATVRATSFVKMNGNRTFTATFEGNVYDVSGNVIGPITGTETATRIRVQ